MLKVTAYIYVFFILIVLFEPSTVPAAEMSSKRECAICHIMWLNDFRTNKRTLIEWQPDNVLMKDTQGVVSSEEICYSCHDGYVLDSRSTVWKHNNHKTFVKPSNRVTIPSKLPLSNKGEIYCGTCHSPHGAGAAPDANSSGATSFFREKNIDSSLCVMCHSNEADYTRTNSHPLKAATFKLPDTLFESGSKPASVENKIICQTCHKVHGAKGKNIAIVDNKSSRLCFMCHDKQKDLIGTKHDLRASLPDEKNFKQQKVSESGPCGACHTPHNATSKMLWARRLRPGNIASQMCLTCHGEKMGYNIKRIGNYSHPVDVEAALNTSFTSKLPLYSATLKKSPEGRVQCFTCHEVHRWDPNAPTNQGGTSLEGDASNSFLRISNDSSSSLCMECHADKKQLITSDHNLQVTATDEKNLQGFTTSDSGPCSACHIPHNAAGSRLWAKQMSGDKDIVTQLCVGCHNKSGVARAKLIGDNDHPVDVTFKQFNMDSARKRVDTMLPLYDKEGNRKPEEMIVCLTCHEPHVWNPQKSVAVSEYTYKNIEGDTTNSFLRKANFPSSGLCKVCHPNNARVDGTVHDLNVSAPRETNLLGQTVKESGTCGACHLVHNSPNTLKLWARPFGPIAPNESISSALCTSCHSKGNLAENKIPLISAHPEGKLINNILRVNKDKRNYTLIFDKYGKEVNFGNIACPSCHNSHKWGHEKRKIKENQGAEPKGRFLRVRVHDIVCVDCHGPDALLKYQYFHDPEKRAETEGK